MVLLPYIIITVGLLVLSRLLYRPPKDARQSNDDAPASLSNRGEYIPLLFGIRKVGPYIAWVGDRVVEHTGGGGGKKGGGSPRQTNYYENACHVLCVGPCDRLLAIVNREQVVWQGPIDSDTTPSGTTIVVPGQGSFIVYWGEIDQPIDTFLGAASRLGFNSRWPYVMKIVWIRKSLGSSTSWPDLEYIVGRTKLCTPLTQSEPWVDAEGAAGLNGAHILAELCFAQFPHGAGLPIDYMDVQSWEDAGVILENEHLPMNMLVERGASIEKPIQAILQDAGIAMPQYSKNLLLMPFREPVGAVPVLDDDVVMAPDLEQEINRGDEATTRPVFVFKNEWLYGFADSDIAFDDDSEGQELNSVGAERIILDTVTNPNPASKIARRRSQEGTIQSSIRISVLRGARKLICGHVFDRPGIGRLRVLAPLPNDERPSYILECTMDTMGVPDIDDEGQPTGGGSGSTPLDVEKDVAFRWIENPAEAGSGVAISVLRTRAHEQIAGAAVHLSTNNASFSLIGNQDYACPGGKLTTALASGTADTIATGPIFESSNLDASSILNLSSDPSGWMSGRQIALINDELFFVESVTVQSETTWAAATAKTLGAAVIPTTANGYRYVCTTAGTTGATQPTWPTKVGLTVTDGSAVWECRGYRFQTNNLIRARAGTVQGNHSINDRIFIADTNFIERLTHASMQPGNTIYIKTQPFTASQYVDLGSVTSVSGVITGGATGETYRTTTAGDYRITRTGENRITR